MSATLQVDEAVLARLRQQAEARGMDVQRYLALLADVHEAASPPDENAKRPSELTMEEFEALLDEMASMPTPTPPLPADFSRRDIYADHD